MKKLFFMSMMLLMSLTERPVHQRTDVEDDR